MNLSKNGRLLILSVLLGSTPAFAKAPEAEVAEKAKQQAGQRAEQRAQYEAAVMQARIEQQAALEAVEGARTDMLRATEARAKAQERSEVFESDRAQHA